jgi:hypothetical protein
MFARYSIFLLCLLLGSLLAAQPVIRTNENGEAIIVFPDGRTIPFSEYSGEENASQSGNENKYPVLDVEIAPLEGKIPVTSEDLRRISERKSQLAKSAAEIAQDRARQATQQLVLLEEQYAKAVARQLPSEEVQHLEARLAAARATKKETEQEAQLAKAEASNAEEITRRGTYVQDYIKRQQRRKDQAKQYEGLKLTASASYDNLVLDDNYLPFAHTDEVILHPPAPGCKTSYEGKDERGRYRKDLEKQMLFTHTNESLRPYLEEGREYLSCSGFFTQIGGFRYLTLEFTFAYPNAREAYGFIEKGSYLMIKMLNNQSIMLFSGKLDRGNYDTETQLLTYSVHYPIDQSQLNLLKRSEADKVVVSWSSGYEEYEVYELGFFINQIACLDK